MLLAKRIEFRSQAILLGLVGFEFRFELLDSFSILLDLRLHLFQLLALIGSHCLTADPKGNTVNREKDFRRLSLMELFLKWCSKFRIVVPPGDVFARGQVKDQDVFLRHATLLAVVFSDLPRFRLISIRQEENLGRFEGQADRGNPNEQR